MNQPPLVTVYITTRNRCRLLERAVDSVLAQTYKNYEIIVCNDASTDRTASFLEDMAKKHRNFRYYSTSEAKGACVLRNIAIKEAKGEFITGLDDDDYFLPSRLERFVEQFDVKYSFLCTPYF